MLQKHKAIKCGIAATAVCALLAGCTIVQAASTDSSSTTAYKENTVTKGDITVGISETATVTMSAVSHTAGVNGTLEEVYIKAGQVVQAGDPVALVTVEDVDDELAKLQLSYNQASVKLEQAKLNRQLSEMQAQYDYTESKNLESTAPVTYDQTIQQLEYELATLLDDITEAEEKYEYYLDKIETSEYGDELSIGEYRDEYISCRQSVERITTSIKEEQASSAPDSDILQSLNEELERANKALKEADEAYDSIMEQYKEAVSNAESEMSTLQRSITSLKNEYERALSKSETTKSEAAYQLEESLEKSKNADAVYKITLSQLESDIKNQELSLKEIALEISELKENEGEKTIKAECSGTVMSISGKKGATVSENDAIAAIADSSEAYALTSIAQEDISDIELGKTAELVFDAFPEERFTGAVDSITTTPARSSSSTVSYQVSVLLDGDMSKVFEGMTGTVTFVAKQVKDVLCISNRAVTAENGVQYVKVKQEDGTIEQVEVTTGFSDGRNCEVKTGLNEGDIVIIESKVNQK